MNNSTKVMKKKGKKSETPLPKSRALFSAVFPNLDQCTNKHIKYEYWKKRESLIWWIMLARTFFTVPTRRTQRLHFRKFSWETFESFFELHLECFFFFSFPTWIKNRQEFNSNITRTRLFCRMTFMVHIHLKYHDVCWDTTNNSAIL